MPILENILKFLNVQITKPELYGTFHIVCLVLMISVSVLLCYLWERGTIRNVRNVLLVTAIVVLFFEVYKQINFTFQVTETGIKSDYQWNAFPWQLSTIPIYISFIASLSKGRVHQHACAYLSTYALFSGLAVMLYPATAFTETLGICIQTMICHGSMVVIAIFLYYTEHVYTEWKTLLRAIPIFCIALSGAIFLNEIYHLILPDGETFNMFLLSRHYPSDLPVYSIVHNWIMGKNPALYPICLLLYVIGFTAVAALLFYIVRIIKRIIVADYDAEYYEMDLRRRERQAKRQEKLRLLEEKRKEERDEDRQRRKERQEEIKERREKKRDEKRTLRQKERARRKKARKEARKAKRKAKRKANRDARREKQKQKQKERQEQRRLEKRMKDIEKREKQEEKARQKAEKEERKRQKAEEKAYKKWVKEQEKLGNYEPDIEEFYDWYYG